MSVARVLEYYDRVADAPDAVEKLRGFVLDLAVRGRLVEQRDKETPASVHRLTVFPAHAFELPSGWSWSDIGGLCSKTGSGSTPRGGQSAYKASGIPFLRSQNVYDEGLRLNDVAYIDEATHRRMAGTAVNVGDLLLNITGGSIGRCCLVDSHLGEANVSQHVAILRPTVGEMRGYLHKAILSPFVQAYIFSEQTGAGRGGLPKNRMDRIPMPVPPIEEQHRIVAKVAELMALCDRLEASRAAREAKRERFTIATFSRLTSADSDPSQFRADARFALDSLALLVRNSDDLALLRQSILELGVRGKLVAQRAGDGLGTAIDPAANKLTKPFDVPSSWTWARLAALGVLKGGGTPSKARDDFWNGTIPWVSPRDMKQDYVDGSLLSITDAAVEHSAVSRLPSGTLLFVVRGMILAHSFPVALTRREVTINQDMKALVPSKPEMAEYLLRALKALKPIVLTRVQRSSHGTGRIEGSDYQQLLIPVPPIPEQVRIVQRIDELMRLCDQIERSLQNSQQHRSGLLEASLSLL